MRPIISFLIGSGFSIPDGLPSVSLLNRRLSRVKEDELAILPSQTAVFLNEVKDPSQWHKQDERVFFQEFLNFYNQTVLKTDQSFHYETFYDFYSNYLEDRENEMLINEFYQKFKLEFLNDDDGFKDCYNRITDFNRTFNQLLASLLDRSKYHEDVTILDYPPYTVFIEFLSELLVTHDIKVHTLNHDLLFDFIGRNHIELKQHFSDGYSIYGSPYYGIVSNEFHFNIRDRVLKRYHVKLEHFTDKYDTPLCLFKLHGSLDNKIFYTPKPKFEKIRVKDNYAVSKYLLEVYNEDSSNYEMQTMRNEVVSDYLSGTTSKIRNSKNDSHYINLFNHFKKNLLESELLFVIGYGFKDDGVNEYIENNYLKKNKLMVVVDPNRPNTSLFETYNIKYVPNSLTDLTTMEFTKLISTDLR
jgi:hypothetical protein